MARIRNGFLALVTLPGLALSLHQRRLYAEMKDLLRRLPGQLDRPLAEALASLTPSPRAEVGEATLRAPGVERHSSQRNKPARGKSLTEDTIRRLADVAARFERNSPLGLCLRRSLIRYHFLRREGVPVVLHFGARFKDGRADREVTGHAWLTLDGKPYFEENENYLGFAAVVHYPPA